MHEPLVVTVEKTDENTHNKCEGGDDLSLGVSTNILDEDEIRRINSISTRRCDKLTADTITSDMANPTD